MNKRTFQIFICSFILLLILAMNYQNIVFSSKESVLDFPQTYILKKTDINPLFHLGSLDQNNETYSISNIQNYNLIFTNKTTGNVIFLNKTMDNQICYFTLNQTLSSGNFSITLLNSNHVQASEIIYKTETSSNLNGTYGQIQFVSSPNWFLEINTTYDFTKINYNQSIYLKLTLYFPDFGYSFDNPITVYDTSQIDSPENYSALNYQVLYPFQTVYFKLNVEPNRRIDFVIKELTPLILNNSVIRFYQIDPTSKIPLLINDIPRSNGEGSYNYSWVSNTLYNSSTFWVKIQLQAPNNQAGSFSILFSFQQSGYSIDSAFLLNINSTFTYTQLYTDRYSSQIIYFKFRIPYSEINVSVNIKSKNPIILANSKFNFYFEKTKSYIFQMNENESNTRGEINKNFISPKAGTYYIEYIPTDFTSTGSWVIEISFNSANPTHSAHLNNLKSQDFLLIIIFILIALGIICGFIIVNFKNYSLNSAKSTNSQKKSIHNFLKNFISFLLSKRSGKKVNQIKPLSETILEKLKEIEKENDPDQ